MKLRGEDGTATLELALVTPALMLLVLGVLQFGLWYHAEHVARTAAIEAARVAGAENGTEESARARADEVLRAGLGNAAEGTTVSVSADGDSARAVVTASLRGLLPIPGLSEFRLHGEASSYRERFRPAGEGP